MKRTKIEQLLVVIAWAGLIGGTLFTVLFSKGILESNIEMAFRNYTHVDKIRVAKFVTQTITSNINEINIRDGKMNTVLGLLAKGDINCAGEEFDPNGNLFATPKQVQVDAATEQRRARQATEIPAGVVRTAEEIRRADEEARLKREEEERQAREKAEEEAREAERIRKENSIWSKGWKKLKNFGETILGPEEE